VRTPASLHDFSAPLLLALAVLEVLSDDVEMSEFLGPDPSHIGTTEVDGPATPERCSVLEKHYLLIYSELL
jgi:hypothetical protein